MRLALALSAALILAGVARADDLARWRAEAMRVEIVRDDWGIAHVHGRSDADAVFGMIYAQAEDDFPRIEKNYVDALGRAAEVEGEAAIWRDLRQRLFIDPKILRARYAASPAWMKALMQAWADDFYLATHPAVRPKLITRFEPWMALAFSEGSIGGDIESVSTERLAAFYGATAIAEGAPPEPYGSNGIAIAAKRTAAGHALLLINPHTSYYFRSEAQVRSDEGLDAYGATTWGQFFVYQGFNPHAGWMHTSSGADCVDEFAETVARRGGGWMWRSGREWRPVAEKRITLAYRTPTGGRAERTFTAFATAHGPVVRSEKGRWIAVSLMDRPVEALEQAFLRTKARNLAEFQKAAELRANSSNNTLFADDSGEIALLLPQFVPRRDDRFDHRFPVDGSDPRTAWRGMHALAEIPHVIDPASGYVFNTNDAPWTAAGPASPRRADFPRYMDEAGENARGLALERLLPDVRSLTPEGLRRIAYDPFMPAFAALVPSLVAAYDAGPKDPALAGPIAALRAWDDRWDADSVATTLAVLWAERLKGQLPAAGPDVAPSYVRLARETSPTAKLRALAEVRDRLTRDFGRWQVPWGEINRFQRIAEPPRFSDSAPSLPVAFAPGEWGSLASIVPAPNSGTKRRYGNYGDTFVAVVEFGPKVRAWAVSAGGESGEPASPHFADQALRFATGDLLPVYFWPEELEDHIERSYRPGG